MLGGRYRLVAPVGVGTSSRVYLAVDTQLRRRVAVKLLHEALAEDEAFLRRFRAEARAAGALSHPNILAVFDWGEDRSEGAVVPYLVTEYLGGGSLRDILDRSAPLSPSQTLLVGLDAARALAHAHQRGLVHRDVKPANLLFDDEGRLRSGRLRSGPSAGRGVMDRAQRHRCGHRPVLLARAGLRTPPGRPLRRVLARAGAGGVRDRQRALRR